MSGAVHRRDIDGLRAIAVVPVVLFHAGVPGFSGGFVGVDVFFVISGYLITQVLLADRAGRRFSILGFYERRIRRIVPALFAVLAFCTAASLLLIPPDLQEYSTELSATAAFVSNIRFWLEGGYFDTPAQVKPLFHIWSLAVEEQFYIVYPVFLALVFVRWPKRLASLLLVLCALSFAFSAVAAFAWVRTAFFLPPSRAWELLAGCYLATGAVPQVANAKINEALSLAGVCCIAAAIVGFTRETPFPGLSALLPCGGALLLIHANAGRTTRVGAFLGTPPLVFTGLISYSLYLWHWPLLVFWRLAVQRDISLPEAALIVAATFVIATLSWRYVEQPFRHRDGVVGRRALFALFGLGTAAFFAIGAAGYYANGWPGRFSGPVSRMLEYVDYSATAEFARGNAAGGCFVWDTNRAPYDPDRCFTAKPRQRNILLWGDSLAAQFSLALREALAGSGANLMQATHAGCSPSAWRIAAQPAQCSAFNDMVVRRLETQKADAVVLSADWLYPVHPLAQFGALDGTIAQLRARGIAVFLIGPTIAYDERLPVILARAMVRGQDPRTVRPPLAAGLLALDRDMRGHYAAMPGVTYVSAIDQVCPNATCPTMPGPETPMVWGKSHLTLAGARYVVGVLTRGPLRTIVSGAR